MSLERSSFRRNFQGWVELNYGENSRTKTITRKKFNKICRYLLGEPQIETDAKFRFWVKSKGFRIVHMDDGRSYGVLYVPVKVPAHTRSAVDMYPYEDKIAGHSTRSQVVEYRRVAVADDFFDIISSVHINDRGVHVGQKKTYKAVANTYAFLPREAVSYYLMSCSTCKQRIQRFNSILLKHGRPLSPVSDLGRDSPSSDLESDVDASFSSHDSDEDGGPSFGAKRFKRDIVQDIFEENGNRNGRGSPINEQVVMDVVMNGNHSNDVPRDAPEGPNDESLAKGLLPGYQTYSSDQKQEVVNYAKETTVREASRRYNVPRSTVQVWCKHGPPMKKEKRSPGGGGRRLSYSNETDEKLLQWVLRQQEKGTPVTRDAIQAQARLLIRDECPEFKASSGWVEKFLARHNLTIATKMSSQNPNEAIPISYVVPVSSISLANPGVVSNSANSPHTIDGRSVTSEDARSDSGKSEEDGELYDATSPLLQENTFPVNQIIREPPNLNEVMKPMQNVSSPASQGLKDDDDDDGEGEDAEGEGEKVDPLNVNSERLKAFNMFVRLFVDENLDRLVPISKQPKEKILAIIKSCNRQFPEFRDRARKRIRTYLKSCRRLKKLKEPLKRAADQMNILASACASEAEEARYDRVDGDATGNPGAPASTTAAPASSLHSAQHSTSNTRTADKPAENGGPTLPKPKVLTQCQISANEIQAIRQLIAGYRESAAFLYRSADELEALLPPL
ncbi:nucleolar protein 4-like isoform X2 [Acropora palmata]|uniref:nucleolar protein 4-like isoform X2 n=1 Tax=Acropora palmata TaxID=6131 RepID=UPI003DA0F82B